MWIISGSKDGNEFGIYKKRKVVRCGRTVVKKREAGPGFREAGSSQTREADVGHGKGSE